MSWFLRLIKSGIEMTGQAKERQTARRSRRYVHIFPERVSHSQWKFLQLLALADRQQLAVHGHTFVMCQRLEEKGLVKISPVDFRRKTGGFVTMTDKGSALVARGLGAR